MDYKLLIAGVFLLALGSCKEENKEEQTMVEAVPAETFDVDLSLVVKQDDSLQLFYRDESMADYEEQNSVWAAVQGSDMAQKISFKLPEDIVPEHIRLDFGKNSKQDPIEVKEFSMKYYDKVFQVKDTMFYQYFIPNEQIEWDRKAAVAKPIVKEGTVYDPLFYPRGTLDLEIEKLVKQ